MKKAGRILCYAAVGLLGWASSPLRADDSAVTPFVDAQTNAVISVDMTRVDIDKLDDWRKKAMATTPDSPDKTQKEAQQEENFAKAKEWIGKFTAAGGKDLLVVVSLGNVMQIGPGAIIVPLAPGATSDAMSKVFLPDGNPPEGTPGRPMQPRTAMVGNSMVFGTGMMVTKLQTPSVQVRPDLTDALAAGADSPIKIVVVPSTIKALPLFAMFKARAAGQGQELPFSQPEWDNVTWALVTFVPPPSEAGSFVCQCKDAASANALAKMFSKKLEANKADPKARATFGDNLDKLTDAAKPVVDGTKVTISVDQNTMDNVVGPMMTKAMAARQANAGPGGPGGGEMPPQQQPMDNGTGGTPGGGM